MQYYVFIWSVTKNAKPFSMNLDGASPRIDPFVFLARADWVMQHFIKRNGVITSYQPCTLWPTLFQFRPEIILLVFQLKQLKIIQHFLSRSWAYKTLPSIWISKLRYGKVFQFVNGLKTVDKFWCQIKHWNIKNRTEILHCVNQ